MAIAHISWTDSPSSVGTLVEYKEQSSSTWLIPNNPTNPTPVDYYDLQIEENVIYDVRISSILTSCGPIYKYFTVFKPAAQCCPPGWETAPDGSYCYKIEEVPATPPSNVELTVARTYPTYGIWGTQIYEPGFSVGGVGVSNGIPLSNNFWKNGDGNGSVGNNTDGPLNRTGVWAATLLNNQDMGYGVCLNITEEKVYYIGIGADNYGIIRLDGQVILQQTAASLAIQFPTHDNTSAFQYWHIFPVVLTSGPHFMELLGHNDFGPAAVGCEIYNATKEEIAAATSYADLGNKLIFSSKNHIGQPVQLGTQGVGYSCPDSSYSLSTCGTLICKRIITTPCSSTTTTTTTLPPSTTTTTTSTTSAACPSFGDFTGTGYNGGDDTNGTVRYGTLTDGNTPTEAEILSFATLSRDVALDIPINWGASSSTPVYYVFAVPAITGLALKTTWFESLDNEGTMLSNSDLFNAPTLITVSGIQYYVYITQYATQFVPNNYIFGIGS